jgi:aspartate aminotransferase/aminotransferase
MNAERFIAEHMRGIGESGIRRVFNLAADLEDPINLSIGEPDFGVPPNVRAAMIRAIEDGHTRYTVTRGIAPLRERIARQLQEEFDWRPDLFVTCGVSGGLLLALMACINPGDEVLIGDPYFVSYKHLVRLVGGVPRAVSLYDDFQLHPERFAEAVTGRTKIVIVFTQEDVQAIAKLCEDKDLLLISDEIYNLLTYDGPAPSPVRYAKERTLLLRGYSKSYAMTGLRMGYAAGPGPIIAEMAKLQQYTFVCAPHPAQWAAIEAMDTDVSPHVVAYREKRNLVCDELEGVFDFVRPSGGFYIFPKAPSGFTSATTFVEQAIRNNVLIIPGNVFSERDTHFRISYAATNDKIRKGCELLRSLARSA